MPRHRRFLSLWITTGLVIGVGTALLGVGGPGVAQACSCAGVTDDEAFEAVEVAFVGNVVVVDDAGVVDSSLDAKRYSVEVTDVAKGEASPEATEATLPTDAPTSAKNSTAGSLVLVGVVVVIATAALVLTLKYRKR